MTMQITSLQHKVSAVEDCCDTGAVIPYPMFARVRDAGVTLGWRLTNIGLNGIGMWMVRTCVRSTETTTS